MTDMIINFKKTHEDAVLPQANHGDPRTGDTGYDLTAVVDKKIAPGHSAIIDIGLEVGYITPGYWFKIEARSGLGFKYGLQPHFGIIDNSYRGNCAVKIYNLSNMTCQITKGDRIAQLVVYKLIQPKIEWVEDVEETKRGSKGIGSSGR